jgi:hypothetical protein
VNEYKPDQDDLLGFLAREAQGRPDPEEHPSIETLSAYGTGRLSEEESEQIQDHLILCRECSGLVLSLKELLRAQISTPESSPAVADFAARRREMEKPATPVERRPRSAVPAYALAALFALATTGLGFYSHSLRSRLMAPVANPPIVGATGGERGSSRETVKLAPGEETPLFFFLTTPYGDYSPEYVVEVRSAVDGRLVRRLNGLIPNNKYAIAFSLYSEDLESGSYDIILKHSDGTEVERHSFDLVRG